MSWMHAQIYLAIHLIFSNRSLQPVCKSSSCSQFPEAFGWFEPHSDEQLRIGLEADEAGYFKSIYAGDTPVYGTISGISANWVAARVRLKNHILAMSWYPTASIPFPRNIRSFCLSFARPWLLLYSSLVNTTMALIIMKPCSLSFSKGTVAAVLRKLPFVSILNCWVRSFQLNCAS